MFPGVCLYVFFGREAFQWDWCWNNQCCRNNRSDWAWVRVNRCQRLLCFHSAAPYSCSNLLCSSYPCSTLSTLSCFHLLCSCALLCSTCAPAPSSIHPTLRAFTLLLPQKTSSITTLPYWLHQFILILSWYLHQPKLHQLSLYNVSEWRIYIDAVP